MGEKRITKSSLETQAFGSNFANQLKSGDVVLLFGELGSGKTTFAAGVAKGLGIKDRILSPTFVLVRQYEIPHPTPRTRNLYHVDLYRIEKQTEIKNLGLEELVDEDNSITVIEWADRLRNFSRDRVYKIYFKHLNGDRREITIEDYE